MSQVFSIGIMQGRLSPPVGGKIQAFPWETWEEEFFRARELGFSYIEWLVQIENLSNNPILNQTGRKRIKEITKSTDVEVITCTVDYLMEAPFYKKDCKQKKERFAQLSEIIHACGMFGLESIMLPLVDNGRITTFEEETIFTSAILDLFPLLEKYGMKLTFESDYPLKKLVPFLGRFDKKYVGFTYDTGDRTALCFDIKKEIQALGSRIKNVHIKDRISGGGTVPLGTGDTDFDTCFSMLAKVGYKGPYILQAARGDDEISWNKKNREFVLEYLRKYGG